MLNDTEISEVIKQEFLDPRPEASDHYIWKIFLEKMLHLVDIKTYQAFRGLRACGASFEYTSTSLNFKFPEHFDKEFRDLVRNKYIVPKANIIQKIIKYIYEQINKGG